MSIKLIKISPYLYSIKKFIRDVTYIRSNSNKDVEEEEGKTKKDGRREVINGVCSDKRTPP